MIPPIQALTPLPALPVANAAPSAHPANVTINQSNVAFVSGSVESLTLANIIDLQGVEADNITINQSNTVIIANRAYGKAVAARDVMDALIDQMLAQLVTGVSPEHDRVVLPVPDSVDVRV